jgi:transcriptional regulator with XRE-family HTH domain
MQAKKGISWERNVYISIGKKIRDLRIKEGISQAALGSAIALTRASITNIEQGRQKILVHTLLKIARELNVDLAELIPTKEIQFTKEKPNIPKGLSKKDRDLITYRLLMPSTK